MEPIIIFHLIEKKWRDKFSSMPLKNKSGKSFIV